MPLLPTPFRNYIPKILQDRIDDTPSGTALVNKSDEHIAEWKNDILEMYFFKLAERCPSKFLDELGYYLAANLQSFDTDRQKRQKIYNTIAIHKKRSSWPNDAKLIVDSICGNDSSLVSNYMSAGWMMWGQESTDLDDYTGTMGKDDVVMTARAPAGAYAGSFRAMAYGVNLYVIVGTLGEIQTSPDGIIWTVRTPAGGFANTFHTVIFGSGQFIVAGDGGEIQTSPDGITWTAQTADGGFSNSFRGGTFGDNLFVLIGDSGEIQTSPDGIIWTQRTADGAYAGIFRGGAYGNGIFVISGSAGEIQTSPDGITWTAQTPAGAYGGSFFGGTFGNRLFVIVGSVGEIQTSYNGVTWTAQTPAGAYAGTFTEIIYGDKIFMVVGTSAEIQVSSDGITWVNYAPAGVYAGAFYGVGYEDNLFIALGDTAEIETSNGYNNELGLDMIGIYDECVLEGIVCIDCDSPVELDVNDFIIKTGALVAKPRSSFLISNGNMVIVYSAAATYFQIWNSQGVQIKAETQVDANAANFMGGCSLDDGFVVVYDDTGDGNKPKFVTYDNSGVLISSGTISTDGVSGTQTALQAVHLTGQTWAVVFSENTGNNGKYRIYEDDTAQIAETTFNVGLANYLSADRYSDTEIIIAYADAGDGGKGKFAVWNTSGVVVISEVTFLAAVSFFITVVMLDVSQGISAILYGDGAVGWCVYYKVGTVHLAAFPIYDSVVGYGTPVAEKGQNGNLIICISDLIVLYPRIKIYSANGDLFQSAFIVNDVAASANESIVILNNGSFAVIYEDTVNACLRGVIYKEGLGALTVNNLVVSLDKDVVPAYFKVILGYYDFETGYWTSYPNGIIE